MTGKAGTENFCAEFPAGGVKTNNRCLSMEAGDGRYRRADLHFVISLIAQRTATVGSGLMSEE